MAKKALKKKKVRVKRPDPDDPNVLTDKYGRLKILKTSDYLKDMTQGED
tara:strand:- start:1134 stop:1280 length:147 start_codon:yes stop_codon:yes gene_type:complete